MAESIRAIVSLQPSLPRIQGSMVTVRRFGGYSSGVTVRGFGGSGVRVLEFRGWILGQVTRAEEDPQRESAARQGRSYSNARGAVSCMHKHTHPRAHTAHCRACIYTRMLLPGDTNSDHQGRIQRHHAQGARQALYRGSGQPAKMPRPHRLRSCRGVGCALGRTQRMGTGPAIGIAVDSTRV